MLTPEDIVNPVLRAAAVRFERETGRSLAANLGDERDEGIIGIFLIVNGYPPGQVVEDFLGEARSVEAIKEGAGIRDPEPLRPIRIVMRRFPDHGPLRTQRTSKGKVVFV